MRFVSLGAFLAVAALAGGARAQDGTSTDTPALGEPAAPATDPTPMTTPTIMPTATTTSSSDTSVSTSIDHAPPRKKGIERNAWYIGFGVGAGASSLAENSFGGTPLAGMTSLRAGAIINDRILVGGQVTLTGQFYKWAESEATGAAVSSVLAEGMYFPIADLPFSVAAGLGWGSALKVARLADTSSGSPRVVTDSGNGIAWMTGAGWDFFAGKGFNLGLQARYEGMSSGNTGTSHTGSLNLWFNYY